MRRASTGPALGDSCGPASRVGALDRECSAADAAARDLQQAEGRLLGYSMRRDASRKGGGEAAGFGRASMT